MATVTQTEAAIAQSQASVNMNQVNVDHCIITAPIDGIITQRSVDVGQTVAASMQAPTLFVIAADLTKMQVNANIDEADVGRIRPQQRVTFRVDAYPTEQFEGTVIQIRLQPVVQSNVTTYGTIISAERRLEAEARDDGEPRREVSRKNDAVRYRTRPFASGRRRRCLQRSISRFHLKRNLVVAAAAAVEAPAEPAAVGTAPTAAMAATGRTPARRMPRRAQVQRLRRLLRGRVAATPRPRLQQPAVRPTTVAARVAIAAGVAARAPMVLRAAPRLAAITRAVAVEAALAVVVAVAGQWRCQGGDGQGGGGVAAVADSGRRTARPWSDSSP
jgi:hypothetical protein